MIPNIEPATLERTCGNCQKPLHGRTDKKFCNDHCRNAVNNVKYSVANNYIRNVNHALIRNRKILERLSAHSKMNPVNTSDLLSQGFRMEFSTHQVKQQIGNPILYCYEFGYQVISETKCRIIKPKKINK